MKRSFKLKIFGFWALVIKQASQDLTLVPLKMHFLPHFRINQFKILFIIQPFIYILFKLIVFEFRRVTPHW